MHLSHTHQARRGCPSGYAIINISIFQTQDAVTPRRTQSSPINSTLDADWTIWSKRTAAVEHYIGYVALLPFVDRVVHQAVFERKSGLKALDDDCGAEREVITTDIKNKHNGEHY